MRTSQWSTCQHCGLEIYNRAEDYGWSGPYWVHVGPMGGLGSDLCYWSPSAEPVEP